MLRQSFWICMKKKPRWQANRCELKEGTQIWICATFRAAKDLELWAVPSYFDHFTFREMGLCNTETIPLPHQEDYQFLTSQTIFWLDEAFKSEFTPQSFPTCWLSACPIYQQHRRAELCKDNLKNPLTHTKKNTAKLVRYCQELVKPIMGWGWMGGRMGRGGGGCFLLFALSEQIFVSNWEKVSVTKLLFASSQLNLNQCSDEEVCDYGSKFCLLEVFPHGYHGNKTGT